MYVILFTLCKIDLTFDSFQEKQFSFQKLPSQAQHNEQKLRKNFDFSLWDKQHDFPQIFPPLQIVSIFTYSLPCIPTSIPSNTLPGKCIALHGDSSLQFVYIDQCSAH